MIQEKGKEKFFSPEAMEKLMPFREIFEKWNRSKVATYQSANSIRLIHSTYVAETGDKSVRGNTNCQRCLEDLTDAVTPIFLDTLEKAAEDAKRAADKETPAAAEKAPQKPRKRTTKTAKK